MKILVLIKDIVLTFLFPKANVYTACLSYLEEDLSPYLSVSESKDPIPIISLFNYKDDIIQTLIKGLKYHGCKDVAVVFGEHMGEFLLEELSDESFLGDFREPVLVPVPISQHKKQDRGYNQSDLLTKYAARHLRKALPVSVAYDAVKRLGHAKSQAQSKNREERMENVSSGFVVANRAKIRGRNVLLIDDVVTTGATLKALSDELRKAGASEVRALVVAH